MMTSISESEITRKSIDQLYFDPENPRLPSNIDKTNEQMVLEWMLEKEKIVELMIAIGERNYFSGEPLLVVESPKNSNKYAVIEGNRRLAAVKLLSYPHLARTKKMSVQVASDEAKHKPKNLPVLVFQSGNEILKYLGYRHVTGVEPWDSLAKARYLEKLYLLLENENREENFKELARTIGSRSDYVKRLLTGYAIYKAIENKDFYKIKGLGEEEFSFSLLTTAMNYQNLQKFLDVDDKNYPDVTANNTNLEIFIHWVFEKDEEGRTRLGESRNLKYLNAVVANSEARRQFEAGESLEQAAMLTEMPDTVFQNSILQAKKYLQVALKYFHEVNSPDLGHVKILDDIASISKDLSKLTLSKIKGEE